MNEPTAVPTVFVPEKPERNPLAGVECRFPVTNAGILQHQHQHLVEENQRLTALVKNIKKQARASEDARDFIMWVMELLEDE